MIDVKDVRYVRGQQVVLDGFTLSVQTSEVLSIMGPSGSGKSSFLKLLAGLDKPQAGTILVKIPKAGADAVDITELDEEQLNQYRRYVGMVFQYAALFDSMTVFENIAFPITRFHPELGDDAVEAQVRDLLETVGLNPEQDAAKMPAQLSGGMRKRVGLARALALEPDIILYDEPSSGLDPVSAANIDLLIREMQQKTGATSVVVSHHVSNLMAASDRVAMLYGGKVLALGTPEEIQACDDPRVQQFITGSAEGPLTDVRS